MGYFESFIGVNFWTALATLLSFLVLFFVAKRFLLGPILNIIQQRQQEIDDLYDDANKAKTDAQLMQAEYQQKLDTAHAMSEQIVRDAVLRGQSREEEILRQANAEASAIMEKAAADIQQEKKKALNDAKDEISDLALAIAAKVVDRELSSADHDRLVNQFIDELGGSV